MFVILENINHYKKFYESTPRAQSAECCLELVGTSDNRDHKLLQDTEQEEGSSRGDSNNEDFENFAGIVFIPSRQNRVVMNEKCER